MRVVRWVVGTEVGRTADHDLAYSRVENPIDASLGGGQVPYEGGSGAGLGEGGLSFWDVFILSKHSKLLQIKRAFWFWAAFVSMLFPQAAWDVVNGRLVEHIEFLHGVEATKAPIFGNGSCIEVRVARTLEISVRLNLSAMEFDWGECGTMGST